MGGEDVEGEGEECHDWATSLCCIATFSLIGAMISVSLEECCRTGVLLPVKMAAVGTA